MESETTGPSGPLVDDANLGGRQFSKETSQSSGSLKLCRANVETDGSPSSET
jgi:hypothetical protein